MSTGPHLFVIKKWCSRRKRHLYAIQTNEYPSSHHTPPEDGALRIQGVPCVFVVQADAEAFARQLLPGDWDSAVAQISVSRGYH